MPKDYSQMLKCEKKEIPPTSCFRGVLQTGDFSPLLFSQLRMWPDINPPPTAVT